MKLLLLNGPNLNMTGIREKAIYGDRTLSVIEEDCVRYAHERGAALSCMQSNCEGELIDALHGARGEYDGVIINPGALAHYSYALMDAIAASGVETLEVHMSNIAAREPFRAVSVTMAACVGAISGLGAKGYLLAIDYFFMRGKQA